MSPNESDASLLWDTLRSAREVVAFTDGVSREAYLEDLMRQRAVERSIEIVGEAARGLSKPLRDAYPEIEWRPIMATRHILAHDYATVSPSLVWRIAVVHVPALIPMLEAILPDEPREDTRSATE